MVIHGETGKYVLNHYGSTLIHTIHNILNFR